MAKKASESTKRRRLAADDRGAALIEFAFVAPVMLMILMGIIAYGQYFWLAHCIQQVANDGARAAIAGLTADERRALSQTVVARELARTSAVNPASAATLVDDDGDLLRVSISYDASGSAAMHFGLVPLPSSTIRRSAIIDLDNG